MTAPNSGELSIAALGTVAVAAAATLPLFDHGY
jgi:hypothetical protein